MNSQRVFVVRPGDVSDMIPMVMPWLLKMARWTRGRRTVDDIVRRVLNMESVLWITLAEDGKPSGAMVTKVEAYPQMKMLQVLHMASDTGQMDEIADELYEALDAFAKFNHCAGVEFVGRPGWQKYVEPRGYTTKSVMYQRFFEGAQHA